jgi:hypothetical protein
VPIEYYLKQPPSDETTLTIVDSQGHAVQKFSSQAKDGRALPAAAGMNRFFWDMRYPRAREAASAVQLASFEASRPVQPVAPPGRYLARLTVGGQTYERPFEIRRDSRGTATDADLQAQFDLLVKIRDKVSETSDALTKLREVRRQFDALEKAAATPKARADIAAAKTKLLAIETVLTRLTLSHSLEVTPKGLINKLGTLSGTVAAGGAKPTRQQYEVFDDLSARIAVQLRELQQLIAKEVPGLTARSRQE